MIFFKNLRMFGKLLGAFSVIAVICALVGGIGWYGVNKTGLALLEIGEVRLPSLVGVAKMIEAINNIKAAERTLLISDLSLADRQYQIDDLKKRWAEFEEGYALFEPLPQTPEEAVLWKKALPLLDAWKNEHRKLIALESKVSICDAQSLEAILVGRQLDHVRWVTALDKAVAAGHKFTGQLDPTLCGLGKWLSTYTSDDKSFNALLGQMNGPHRKLHELGAEINELLEKGDSQKARQLFNNEVEPTLASIESIFGDALTMVRANIQALEEGLDTGMGSVRDATRALTEVLKEIYSLNREVADQSKAAAQGDAQRSKLLALIAVVAGALIALAFGYFIAGAIARPVAQVVEMITEMEKGHLAKRLRMDSKDEIGEMAKTMDAFADSLSNELVSALGKLAAGDLTFTAVPRDTEDARAP